jgi:hypothetical protein
LYGKEAKPIDQVIFFAKETPKPASDHRKTSKSERVVELTALDSVRFLLPIRTRPHANHAELRMGEVIEWPNVHDWFRARSPGDKAELQTRHPII